MKKKRKIRVSLALFAGLSFSFISGDQRVGVCLRLWVWVCLCVPITRCISLIVVLFSFFLQFALHNHNKNTNKNSNWRVVWRGKRSNLNEFRLKSTNHVYLEVRPHFRLKGEWERGRNLISKRDGGFTVCFFSLLYNYKGKFYR